MAEEREGFLQRWARLKTEHREGGSNDVPASPPEATAVDTAAPTTKTIEPEAMPSIDDLTAESDFTAFLKEGVPEELKRLALRKLWRTDPVFANLDGLVEYGEDFGAPFRNPGAVATLFRLGQGMPGPEEKSQAEEPVSTEAESDSATEHAEQSGPSKEVTADASKVPSNSDNDPKAVG
jgi:hypothetical protein